MLNKADCRFYLAGLVTNWDIMAANPFLGMLLSQELKLFVILTYRTVSVEIQHVHVNVELYQLSETYAGIITVYVCCQKVGLITFTCAQLYHQ